MDTVIDRLGAPSRQLLWLELRGIWELHAFFAAYPLLRRAPRGDGHPVLVLPGLAASDTSTRPLRAYLTEQGYAAHGWKQGRNQGPRPGVEAGIGWSPRAARPPSTRFGCLPWPSRPAPGLR